MNSAAFLSAVKQEIARLQQIQSLLENESTNANPESARKPISEKRRGMSDAGKARVAEAQRKRWAAIKTAANTDAAPPKKQAAAPVKKSAKTVAVKPAKKQTASALKPHAGKAAVSTKKTAVKKSATAAKSAAAKKVPVAKKTGDPATPKRQSRNVPKQPDLKARDEAPEANAAVPDALAPAAEDSSSNE